MDQSAAPITPTKAATASSVLTALVNAFPNERVTVGELLDELDSRAHGVLLLVLALPICIPNVPGISTIFGVLLLLPSLALTFGQRRLWVPANMRAWTFPRHSLYRTVQLTVPTLRRVEVLIKPRLSRLTRFPVTILVGLQCLLMSLILILPIPFGNWPPAMTLAITALALLQRDGVLMLLSVPAAAASVASVYIFGRVSLAMFNKLWDWGAALIHSF